MDIMDPVWGFRRRLAVRVCVSSFAALELAKAKHGCLMAALAQGGRHQWIRKNMAKLCEAVMLQ